MSIELPMGFTIKAKQAVDTRLVMTKEEMASILKGEMPDNYITVCSDDGKLYIYNSEFDKTEEMGRFKPYEDIIDIPAAIKAGMSGTEGKEAMAEAVATTLPGAMKDVMKDKDAAQEMVDSMFSSEHFETGLDNKIEIAISLIEGIDGIGK